MDIGKTIQAERKKKEWTQAQLASQLFVSRQLISKWETGKGYPDLEQVVQLSELFQLSIDTLLKGDEAMVTELTLATKKKRLLQGGIALLIGMLLIVVTVLAFAMLLEGPLIEVSDLKVMSVEKTVLPEKTIKNQATGQVIIIPEDVSYKVKVKIDQPFVDLSHLAVTRNMVTADAFQLAVFGDYGLFGNQKEATLRISSPRLEDFSGKNLNTGKDIYLMRSQKKAVRHSDDLDGEFSEFSDLLLSWEDSK